MTILLAPDKFRGSLTAIEVCAAMNEGIRLVSQDIEIIAVPMADGGEGTAEILTYNAGGQMKTCEVLDPLGRKIQSSFGLSANKQTAYIEMASASGLKLLQINEYNPFKTSTSGTGQLIQKALEAGVKKIILGIGGSATNDAGIGMAAAMGWQFLDRDNIILEPCGENLIKIEHIIEPRNKIQAAVEVACDVSNPLFGLNGAAYVYAPQKGATPEMVLDLDNGLKHFATIVKRDFNLELNIAGAGAAGGLGTGALFFLNATLKSGIEIIMEQTNFKDKLEKADLVLTGEGKIDEQTLHGKLISGIGLTAKHSKKPVAALCGSLCVSPQELSKIGITYAASVINKPMELEEAMTTAYDAVKESTFSLVSLFVNRF